MFRYLVLIMLVFYFGLLDARREFRCRVLVFGYGGDGTKKWPQLDRAVAAYLLSYQVLPALAARRFFPLIERVDSRATRQAQFFLMCFMVRMRFLHGNEDVRHLDFGYSNIEAMHTYAEHFAHSYDAITSIRPPVDFEVDDVDDDDVFVRAAVIGFYAPLFIPLFWLWLYDHLGLAELGDSGIDFFFIMHFVNIDLLDDEDRRIEYGLPIVEFIDDDSEDDTLTDVDASNEADAGENTLTDIEEESFDAEDDTDTDGYTFSDSDDHTYTGRNECSTNSDDRTYTRSAESFTDTDEDTFANEENGVGEVNGVDENNNVHEENNNADEANHADVENGVGEENGVDENNNAIEDNDAEEDNDADEEFGIELEYFFHLENGIHIANGVDSDESSGSSSSGHNSP